AVETAVRPERITPFRQPVEPIRVVERVSRFVAQIHHDLARILEIVHLLLDPGELRVREIEGDADDRLPGGAAPLVREVIVGAEALQLPAQLPLEPLDQPLHGRVLEAQVQVPDGHPPEGPPPGRFSNPQLHTGYRVTPNPRFLL